MLIKENSIALLQGVFDKSFFDLPNVKKAENVFVLEGRPKLLATKVSCKELLKRKLTPTLITDNMAGFLFYKNMVKEIWIAYQSIESNEVLCQVGALVLGVLGKRHRVPVYLYPSSVQMEKAGKPNDIFKFNGKKIAPSGIKGYVPLTEYLPKEYITKIYDK